MAKIESIKQVIKQLLHILQLALIKAQLLLSMRRYAHKQTLNNRKEVLYCHMRFLAPYLAKQCVSGQICIGKLGITRHLRGGMVRPALSVPGFPEDFYVPYYSV